MGKVLRLLIYWGPAILWMALIFTLSSHQRLSVSPEYWLNFLFFKFLHMVEYATLYFLLFRACYLSTKKNDRQKDLFITPLIIAIIYAATDELHQTFIPTREGTTRDVLIDSVGIFFMYTLIKNNLKRIKFIM